MTCKKSLLVKSKISKLFSNKLSADAKYSLLKWDNLMQPIQMQFSPKKQNIFSIFFVHFWNLVYILNISKKKTALIAHIFTKIPTPKNMVRSISKWSRFKGYFRKQHSKWAKTLFKFEWQHIYHIYWSLWRSLSCKKFLLVICKISKLFPNKLSADGKYSFLNWDNLTKHIQVKLSPTQKPFSPFFSKCYKSSLNFEHFQKKNDSHSSYISEITDSQKHH